MHSLRGAFGKRIPIPIPPELADEASLLAHLKITPAELKKIWWYRARMYSQFNIAKGSDKVSTITAPDKRLKIIQQKLAPLLDQLYRVRNPVHGFVAARSAKTNAEAHGRRLVAKISDKLGPETAALDLRPCVWRRGWDSNPRYPYGHNGFRDRPDRPLWHLSARSRNKACAGSGR